MKKNKYILLLTIFIKKTLGATLSAVCYESAQFDAGNWNLPNGVSMDPADETRCLNDAATGINLGTYKYTFQDSSYNVGTLSEPYHAIIVKNIGTSYIVLCASKGIAQPIGPFTLYTMECHRTVNDDDGSHKFLWLRKNTGGTVSYIPFDYSSHLGPSSSIFVQRNVQRPGLITFAEQPAPPPPLPSPFFPSPPPPPLGPPREATHFIQADLKGAPYLLGTPFGLKLFMEDGLEIESLPIPRGTYIETAGDDKHKVVVIQNNTDKRCTLSQRSFTHFENYKGYTIYASENFTINYTAPAPSGHVETLRLKKGLPVSYSTHLTDKKISLKSLPNNTFVRKGTTLVKINTNGDHECIVCNNNTDVFYEFEVGKGYIISPSDNDVLTSPQ